MSSSLIKTKLNIPVLRPAYIVRPRLNEDLNHDLLQGDQFSRKLTLICAPAGYGKTSLSIDWTSALRASVAWLSLDENDNDPVRFLTYLIHAIRQVLPAVGNPSLEMLQSPQLPGPEVLLAPLLNELEGHMQSLVLVIDDYHLIHTPVIHQHLNFLIEYLPPQMHLVVISREDPPLPLHRLRGRGQLLELRQDSIRFTLEESGHFLARLVGKQLSWENVQAIEHRTEGWVTGMQLLGLSLQQHPNASDFIRSFTGSDRFVLDYLFEEVFHRQEPYVQDFLVRTAILDNLSADLCQAVTGREDSREILHNLDQANLFVHHLDQTDTWYRYHRLFLDLLRHRLQLHEAIRPEKLHLRASDWYEEHGYLEDAVTHALAGFAWERGLALIFRASDGLMKAGAVATLMRWFGRIPQEAILAKPEYCLTYAWSLLLAGQMNEADAFLGVAENNASSQPVLLGEVAAARAFQAQSRGDEHKMVLYSEQALSLLPESDVSSRSIVAMNLGIAYWHSGEMQKAEARLNEAIRAAHLGGNRYAEITSRFFIGRVYAVCARLHQAAGIFGSILNLQVRMPIIGLVFLDLSMLKYEQNDLDAAQQAVSQGLELIGDQGHVEFRLAGQMQKARLAIALGSPQAALEIVQSCSQIAASPEVPPRTQLRVAACMVETALACGELGLAATWAEQAEGGSEAHPFYRFLSLSRVRLLLAQKKKAQAMVLLQETAAKAENAGWGYGLIFVRVLQALAAPDMDVAVEFLGQALQMGHPEGFLRTFIDQGEALGPVLREAARRGVAPEYVGQILSGLEAGHAQQPLPSGAESLSDREFEVLHLLAAGFTNRQIADQLVVSISTVKSHVHHISGKLQVANRTQAVARARQLGLL